MANKNEQPPVCNFCGRSGDEVERLIAGPGVFICNECIEVCRNILEEEMKTSKKKRLPDFELPTPEKNKEYMDLALELARKAEVFECSFCYFRCDHSNRSRLCGGRRGEYPAPSYSGGGLRP